MSKSILLALLTVTGLAVYGDQAMASGRRFPCAMPSYQTATPSATPASASVPSAPAAGPHTGMNTAQANKAGTYQSFSYEPASSPAKFTVPTPAYRTSARTTPQSSRSLYDSVRGDRKARGIMN